MININTGVLRSRAMEYKFEYARCFKLAWGLYSDLLWGQGQRSKCHILSHAVLTDDLTD